MRLGRKSEAGDMALAVTTADVVVGQRKVAAQTGKKGKPSALATLLRKNYVLKKRRPLGTFCEFLLPLLFVILFALLKNLTDKVRIADGWSVENRNSCQFEVAPDGFNKTCSFPYSRFTTSLTSFSQVSSSWRGSWSGHETAKLFLATSTGEAREVEALQDFVDWMVADGGPEGPFETFASEVFILGDGSVEEINAYVASENYGNPTFTPEKPECAAALVFEKIDFTTAQFEYTLRLNSTNSASRFETSRTTLSPTDDIRRSLSWGGGSSNVEYLESGFMSIQQMVDAYLISRAGANQTGYQAEDLFAPVDSIEFEVYSPYGGRMLPFPVKSYLWDEFFFFVSEVIPLVFTLAYLYPVARILEGLVRERETRMTEMLKMMGVSEAKIILSWYITYAVFFLVLALIITLFARNMLPSTTAAGGGFSTFVFFLFYLFGMATVAFCFAISTMFQKARTASFVGVIIYFIGFFFYYSVNTPEVNPKPVLFLLLPQVAFSLSLQTIAVMEGAGVGASAATLYEPVQGFFLAYGVTMLLFDIFFWTGIGFYLSAVLPREYGQRLPWYFPLQPSYWSSKCSGLCGGRKSPSARGIGVDVDQEAGPAANVNVEAVDVSLRQQVSQGRGIQIRKLRKEFSTPSGKKVAVNDLSLDIYEGQILALLGHNGAGKTTAINLLTGMLPVTEGDAIVRGKSIRNSMTEIRASLGFCPQHDVLYDDLTVREHLQFYGRLKGLSGPELSAAIDESIRQVGLVEKRNVRSKSLSGGMKRKLSVAIALIGDSRIVFVDEPTSGVDPYSRRAIWEVLQNNRDGRIIVLTTHFMDEADLLGDRIAIMAEGELRCCGSSLFLKNRFGAGYVLTLVKGSAACDVDRITALVKNNVPAARISTNVGTEVSYQLPLSASGQFSALFRALDNGLEDLGVLSYGMSVTSLEQVFIKVARADDQRQGSDSGNFDGTLSASEETARKRGVHRSSQEGLPLEAKAVPASALASAPLSSCGLFALHFSAMLRKRVQYSRRDGRSFLCSVIMPLVLYTVGLLILKLIPVGLDDPAYVLDTSDFNPTFPDESNAFMPIIELTATGNRTRDVATNNAFDPYFVLEQVDEAFSPLLESSSDVEIELFNHTYINGLPAEDECARTDCNNPSPAHGAAILDFSRKMILDEVPASREGASLYAAAVIQPMPAEQPHSCLLTEFEVNTDLGELLLNYQADPCSDPTSPCLFLEAEIEGAANRICLPAGCLSNLYEDNAIDRLLQAAGFGGTGGFGPGAGSGGGGGGAPPTEEEIAEFERLIETTLVLTCEGALCNTGPSLAFEPSVCRGDGDQTCIADGLVAYNVNASDFSLYIKPGVKYCDGRNITTVEDVEESTSSGFGGGTKPPPGLGNSTDGPRECMVTGIPAEAQAILLELVLGGVTAPPPSFNESTNTCDDAGLACSFLLLADQGANATDVCVVDSCATDEAAVNATLANLELFLPGISSAPRLTCDNIPTTCDQVFDLGDFLGLAQPGTALENILNSTTTGIFGVGVNVTFLGEFLEDLGFGALNGTSLLETLALLNSTGVINGTSTDAAVVLQALLDSQDLTVADLAAVGALLNSTDPNELVNNLLLGDINATSIEALLANPEVQAVLLESLARLGAAESTVQVCATTTDTCVQADVVIQGQRLCVPTGCAAEFDPAAYGWLPLLAGSAAFETVDFFECNITQCNYGCRGAGNCRAEDLEPVRYNATSADFEAADDICPVIPIRYSYTAMINSTARHGAPIVASSIHNALLRTKLFRQFPDFFADLLANATAEVIAAKMPRIVTKSQPLPLTNNIKTIISGIIAFVAAIFALIAFAFIPASTASYVVLEREAAANVKHQQIVSGAGILSYWLSMYVFDMVLYLVPLIGAISLIVGFNIESYIENGALSAVVLLFFGFGLSSIAFSYVTSNFFSLHTTALIGTLFINLLLGLVLMIASYVMASLDKPSVNEANSDLKPFFRVFPGFALGDSLLNLAILKILTGILGPAFSEKPTPFDWDQAGANITYLYLTAAFFFMIALGIEWVKGNPRIYRILYRDPNVSDPPVELDDDVKREEDRVASGEADREGDAIVIDGLRKVFRGGKVAVRNVSLGIRPASIFGYLGVNGAGKTTSLSMLTGKVLPTRGTARLGGLDILRDSRATKSLIGFCPQFDALLPLLTVREHLELFGRIKGLRGDQLELAVFNLMSKMTLLPFEHKLARSLSGGNRRKLSLSIAAIGSPRILFADEPTTGVDVVSARFVWNVLQKMASGSFDGEATAIVLTTHSMEEAEALCDRIGIMVGGRMRCIGSAQHLKNKFGNGLLCEMKIGLPSEEQISKLIASHPDLPSPILNADLERVAEQLGSVERGELVRAHDDSAWLIWHHLENTGEIDLDTFLEWWIVEAAFQKVETFFADHFKGTTLIERHGTQMRFQLPSAKLSKVFELIESNRDAMGVTDFSISNPTIENVFNLFAAQDEHIGVDAPTV